MVSTLRFGLASHYIVGFEKNGGMGRCMTVKIEANRQIIAHENQNGRSSAAGSTWEMPPTASQISPVGL